MSRNNLRLSPGIPRTILLLSVALALLPGCATPPSERGLDSAAVAQMVVDSVARADSARAGVLADSARSTLAALLKNPATATFEEVSVVQPPLANDHWPPMVVCGRISGRPGIGGSASPTAFVYQSRQTVFVEDASNHQAFAELWGRTCANPEAKIIVKEGG